VAIKKMSSFFSIPDIKDKCKI